MTTPSREPADLAALRAERDRLSTITDVLQDISSAAFDVETRKGRRDCAAERVKFDHGRTAGRLAAAEYFAAADAYHEAKWGSESVARSRARRATTFADDAEMRELIDRARADLTARQQTRKPVERDRRRSR
ncbi:hypothetical protein ACFXG4_37715 [Nocardia sp. NPDC059246]|uniref:hypothetical protein n=1 Tax=unclassified Nocardia TaxID=2637762 RepID=UPI0036C8158F